MRTVSCFGEDRLLTGELLEHFRRFGETIARSPTEMFIDELVDADIFHRVRLHEKCAIEMRETVKSAKFRENRRSRESLNSRDFRRLRLKLVLRGREGFFFAQKLQKNRNALKNDAHLARAKNDRP